MILHAHMVMCQLSEVHISHSGRPQAFHEVLINILEFSFHTFSKKGLFACMIAFQNGFVLYQNPSSIIVRTLFFIKFICNYSKEKLNYTSFSKKVNNTCETSAELVIAAKWPA